MSLRGCDRNFNSGPRRPLGFGGLNLGPPSVLSAWAVLIGSGRSAVQKKKEASKGYTSGQQNSPSVSGPGSGSLNFSGMSYVTLTRMIKTTWSFNNTR